MAKNFIIYYKQGTGSYIITEPRPWARENQFHFPGFDFINNHPDVPTIRNYLIENFGFIEENFFGPDITVIRNLDPNLGL